MNAATDARQSWPEPETLAWAGLLVTTEFLLVVGYLLATGVTVRDWTLFVVPFVWINVGIWALVRTDPPTAGSRKRRVAAVLAAGYFLLLAYFGGLIGPGHVQTASLRIELVGIPPGWSPALLYAGPVVSLAVLPYKLVGYVTLAYLIYATALEASGAIAGGVLGIFSCVSCSFPLVAGVLSGVVGGTGAVLGATGVVTVGPVAVSPYVLSTAVFVVTVGLLSWRPAVGAVTRRV